MENNRLNKKVFFWSNRTCTAVSLEIHVYKNLGISEYVNCYQILTQRSFVLFVFLLRLNVAVNNFSVMSGRSQRFLGLTRTVERVNVSFPRTQQGDA